MNPERYQPSPEEFNQAEVFLTSEDKRLSDEREAAIEASRPGEIEPRLGSLLIPFDERLVQLDRLQQTAEQEEFHRKPEFHITILGFTTGKELARSLGAMSESDRSEKISALQEIVSTTDWSPVGADGEILRIHKDYQTSDGNSITTVEQRESFIQKIDLAGTKDFITRVNALLGTTFEVPVTHVTLYTKSTNPKNATLGIGIKNNAEFDALKPTNVEY